MQLIHTLSRWNRYVLLLCLAVLLILEVTLGFAVAHQLGATQSDSARMSQTQSARATAAAPALPVATAAPAAPSLDLRFLPRQPGDLVANGDLTGVAESFDVEEAMSQVEALCAPEFNGRAAGSPEGKAAAAYIADEFARYGLQAAGASGYYQSFSLPYAEVTAVPTLVITQADGDIADTFAFRQDYAWAWGGYSGGGVAEGRVFWVNAGEAGDYQGLDVVGQVVLCRSENAQQAARQALEHGARGLLLLTENEKHITIRRTYQESPYLPQSLPTLWVSPDVASALLEGSGYALDDLTFLYRSLELPAQVYMVVEMNEPGAAIGRNVLGVLPGADPALRDQVLILGAHYDHLGQDPDGSIHFGANDDASGVAVLLEIARSWQAAGYTPERTVLFAAWDAEEVGLVGSTHYVQRPVFPLDSTVGMIQLDMVGLAVTGTLTLDSSVGRTDMASVGLGKADVVTWSSHGDAVAEQLRASAALYGVQTQDVAWGGRSDHAPFLRAGVPAALLIWDAAEVPYYHTPADTVDTLQPERLREAGLITSHAAIALATTAPRLEQVLAAQVQAIRAGDADALVATLDEGDPALLSATIDWLASRPEALAQDYALTVGKASARDDRATVEVTATSRDANDRPVTLAAYPVQFVRRGTDWRTTWPIAQVLTTPNVSLQVVAPFEGNEAWLVRMERAYAQIAPTLGLASSQPITLTLYPNQQTLEWLDLPMQAGASVTSGAPITPTCVGLVLNALGLQPGQGDWLRVGLSRWVEATDDPVAQRQQALQQLSSIDANLTAADLLSGAASLNSPGNAAAAWSMAQQFMAQYGTDGLRRLCAAWGVGGSAEQAFAALDTTLGAFGESWEQAVPLALASGRDGLRDILAQRVAAVKAHDRAAFLATLDPQATTYLAEEAHWFDSLPAVGVAYDLSGELLALGGDTTQARIVARVQAEVDAPAQQTTTVVRLRRVDGRWLLTDRDWLLRETPHLALQYTTEPPAFDEWLAAAERVFAQVSADLGYAPSERVAVKLYESGDDLRASWPLDVPAWREDYVAEDEALKLSVVAPEADAQTLARLLTQRALDDQGLTTDWLREGIATYEGLQAAPRTGGRDKARFIAAVREALPFDRLYAWDAMPAYTDLAEDDLRLYRAQSWLLVDQYVRAFGVPALGRWLTGLERGLPLEQAFAEATGTIWAAWLELWQQRAVTGGVAPEWIAAARSFDLARAQADVARLAAPDFAGRRAGSPGGAATAEWLAEQLQAIGLQPGAPDGSYFQPVPVTYSELTAMPALEIGNPTTSEMLTLEYLQTWGEIVGGAAGGGTCDAGLVWLPRGYEEGMQFGGRVVLERQQDEPRLEAEQALAHGAGGLVLVRQFYSPWQREVSPSAEVTGTLPVAFVGEASWDALIKLAGLTAYAANTAPPASLWPLTVHLSVPYSPAQASEARTVIGVLPGADPNAPPLILAAHYDGLGALPDGTYYPSANKNASGVAVLLEVARALQASGIQPRSSVYVIAWGAEEAGRASSQYFALEASSSGAFQSTPLVLDLDTVGASRSYYLNLDGDEAHEGALLATLLLAGDLLDRRVTQGKADATATGTQEVLRAAGYPTLLLHWPSASALRTPLDTPDTLEPHKLATTGEVVTLASMLLAW